MNKFLTISDRELTPEEYLFFMELEKLLSK